MGKIGEAAFVGTAFLCSPCTNKDCLDVMEKRGTRLQHGPKLELYHKTTKAIADTVSNLSKGRFVRGDHFDKAGAAGGGIYFGQTPRECSWKYEAKGQETVTLKCIVKM